MNKKLFVATSFSGKVDYQTGQVLPEFRAQVESILKALRNIEGIVVFCAIEHEGWLITNSAPEVGVKNDLQEIDESDAVLALLIDHPSEGLQYEMGYSSGKNKTVIAATQLGVSLGYFNQGLAGLNEIKHVLYDSPELLAKQIQQIIGS